MDVAFMRSVVHIVDAKAETYATKHSAALHPSQEKLEKVTSELPYGPIRTEPIEVQFLQVLLKAVGAKNYLEIGKLINVVVRSGRKPAVECPQLKEKATGDRNSGHPGLEREIQREGRNFGCMPLVMS